MQFSARENKSNAVCLFNYSEQAKFTIYSFFLSKKKELVLCCLWYTFFTKK